MVAEGRRGTKKLRPITSFIKAFKTACRKVGYPGRIPHDMRRSAVRNLERAGVPRSVAMKLTGHPTELVYRRYAIADRRDLDVAVERLDLFNRSSHHALRNEKRLGAPPKFEPVAQNVLGTRGRPPHRQHVAWRPAFFVAHWGRIRRVR